MAIPSAEKFLALVNQFLPFHDGMDLCWFFFIRVKRKWKKVSIQKYQDVYYCASSDNRSFSYPAENLSKEIEAELNLWTQELSRYKASVLKNPIEAQATLLQAIPMELRKGLMSRKNARALMPSWANIDLKLSKNDEKILREILKTREDGALGSLTADQYFEYCRIAYLANPKTFSHIEKGLSGKEYYKQHADGRDGGLLSLDSTSEEALKKWYHSSEWQGTHPWEIYRGGNSTHIDLYIQRDDDKNKWSILLNAFSTSRMAETCRIAIALKKAKLPFILANKESYLNRILEEDWVGIVPEELGIKYSYQYFPEQYGVADCIHFFWLLESCSKEKRLHVKRQLKKLIFWLPERMSAYLK